MQRSLPKRFLLNSFWLSVLLHLLVLLAFTTFIVLQPEENRKPPHYYVPSYVYSSPVAPKVQSQQVAAKAKPQREVAKEQVSQQNADEATIKEINHGQQQKIRAAKKPGQKKSILASTLAMLQQNQMRQVTSSLRNSDPIYLVGEHNVPTDPMILLLGKALSAHFEYPRTAGELGIKGRVLIGLTIHPEGHFSEVEIVKSSNDRDLDAAALYAVNQAPIIEGMDRFLSEPKHFVVGFIFQ